MVTRKWAIRLVDICVICFQGTPARHFENREGPGDEVGVTPVCLAGSALIL